MHTKWLIYSISGLMLCGFGLSLLGEAIIFKMVNNFDWFYWGTSALVVFNSGICFVGQAIIIKLKFQKNLKG
tara:strand:- start:532 stop:747 length:216 start_codon:yes stop_codon:yes gene_type:complete